MWENMSEEDDYFGWIAEEEEETEEKKTARMQAFDREALGNF